MTQDPRSRANSAIATSARNRIPAPSEIAPNHSATHRAIKDISQTLAAHGAGAASTELALDLVLHEIAGEAREAFQATAAAIAWMRDGEMVCRATTGHDAPDLGTRIDTGGGMASACVNTRQIQVWRNTDLDSGPSGDVHQQLGARSILFAPIADGAEIIGILQLFSATPQAFEETECMEVQPFVARCIAAKVEAQEWSEKDAEGLARTEISAAHDLQILSQQIQEPETEITAGMNRPLGSRMKEFSNSMLLVAALTVAIVLGLVVGWRGGMQGTASSLGTPPSTPIATAKDSDGASQTRAVGSSDVEGSTASATAARAPSSGGTSVDVSTGGLLILEDGKVVYRAPAQTNSALGSSSPTQMSGLLHRVDPMYPSQALAQDVQGSVVLDVRVLSNGHVGDVAVESGDPLLTEAAVAAVKQWRFTPYSGQAVERETKVTIKFSLPAQSIDGRRVTGSTVPKID